MRMHASLSPSFTQLHLGNASLVLVQKTQRNYQLCFLEREARREIWVASQDEETVITNNVLS